MSKRLKALYQKYREMLSYLFFGGVTTLVNIACYWLCAHPLGLGTVPSTVIAWVAGVAFAFWSNKLFVFQSRSWRRNVVVREAASFVAARAFSGVLDLAFMWVTVDLAHWNDLCMKIISNVIVVILNYLFSKLLIFKKK